MSEECCKKSFFASLGDTAKRLIEDPTIAPQQIQTERLSICKGCEHQTSIGTCDLCGCILVLKVKAGNMTCPDNPPRWSEYKA